MNGGRTEKPRLINRIANYYLLESAKATLQMATEIQWLEHVSVIIAGRASKGRQKSRRVILKPSDWSTRTWFAHVESRSSFKYSNIYPSLRTFHRPAVNPVTQCGQAQDVAIARKSNTAGSGSLQ